MTVSDTYTTPLCYKRGAQSSWVEQLAATIIGKCHSLTWNFCSCPSCSWATSGALWGFYSASSDWKPSRNLLRLWTGQPPEQVGLAIKLCSIIILKTTDQTSLSPRRWIRCRNSARVTCIRGTIFNMIVLFSYCCFIFVLFLMEVQKSPTPQAPGHENNILYSDLLWRTPGSLLEKGMWDYLYVYIFCIDFSKLTMQWVVHFHQYHNLWQRGQDKGVQTYLSIASCLSLTQCLFSLHHQTM